MNVRRSTPRIKPAAVAVAGATVLGLLALSACSSSDATGGGEDGKLDVVASFYPMQFLAEEIGGRHVSVSSLTKPGQEPHDLEINPRQTAQLSSAGLIVYLKGLQPAVDEAVDLSEAKNTVDAASLTRLEHHGTEVGHNHSEAGEHGKGEHTDENSQGHDHGSEDGASDPHIWLDPLKYAQIAKGVGKAMEKADPDHAADYKKNTAALVGKLGGLDDDFKAGLENRATDTFITTHAAFGYLAERYGLVQESIKGLDPESEPSPARMKELQSIAGKDKATTVFYETLVSDSAAKTVAGDTGLKTDVLDPIEGITPKKSRGDDYFEVQRSNLKALRQALGAK
ncbi:metal ABC transporter substrate-binding protein [Streptomyces sp. H27-D2]|uniref:metal ABC transporter substrate-binding protein n=1 Tax=Streptomyces sp. H27-D2 TaxID=3046304 RepID=UPI002DB5F10A|nr:metal ABC transporter substrate-binding protein [Streptomyces sp. H27-D2]MEC4014760.1 metal ABC transporter substrate-binding protein [Streptomyces sp. H27-D2]